MSPRPSISNASRETKCFSRSTACAGQISAPVQRRTASSSSRTAWLLQTGHVPKLVGFCTLRLLVQDDADDLRDHVAGALDDDCGVADSKVDAVTNRIAVVADALDVIFIMQRRVRHDDAANGHRLEPRHRRQRAGAADLDIDALENRGRLLGGEFVRDRPARAARDKTEPVLPVEPVDLVDHAVDVVAERGAFLADLVVEFQDGVDILGKAWSAD